MDPITEWTSARARVHGLTEGLSEADADRTVPACPDWTVRDLLSHMVGLGVDIIAGDHPDDHNATWTQKHVDDRRDHSVTELLAEWDAAAEPMRQWMAANDARPLGDVIIHEQDLRGALGVSGGQDTPGLHAIRDRMAGMFADGLAGAPSVTLRGASWTWSSASSASSAAWASSTDGDTDVVLEASDFDLARALMSRRSAAQLRAWTTKGDIEPLLASFAVLGPLPAQDLSE